jgi:hypothetical protein
MAYGVIVQTKVAALNTDSKNRAAVSAAAYENGSVGNLLTKSTTAGESEVWVLTAPVTGALTNLWMVYEPEIDILTSGTSKYKGLNPDPRVFRNEIGDVFTVFQPALGDLITMSADAVAGTKSTNGFVVATNAAQKLTWAAAAVSGLSLKLIAPDSYISIGSGAIDTQRITAYLFEVVAVA